MKLKLKVASLYEQTILIIILVLVFLYDAFAEVLGSLDELIAVFSILVIFFYIAKGKLKFFRKEYYVILCLLVILLVGLVSNISANHNGNITEGKAIFADFIIFFKAFLAYFGIRIVSHKFNATVVLNKISKYSEYAFYILIFIAIIDIIFYIYPRSERYGINTIVLFFNHSSRYGFAFAFIFLALLPKYYKTKKELLFAVLLMGVFCLRVKYFGFLAISIFFMFYSKYLFRIPKLYFTSTLGVLALLLIWMFQDQIQFYFSFENLDEAWSRAVVLYYSFIIGNDFFPLGTGFGTYSSYYSGYYYSWVYDLYGINNVYGISRIYPNFIADQYWPMVLGQFGYIGLFSMIMIVYNYFIFFLDKIKANRNSETYYYLLAAILGLLMLLIDSTSDSIFTQQRGVVIFIFFALIVNTIDTKHESTSNK
ncbi:hypothetical protein [Psychroserpens sp. SPM9]|uniref:hypothetical protein n=1 Tax=Psychroserpens sp. SPM9 TaxID=2975598 RepID=UPI0021A61928|nr:hypothetical protein [Psychroserpens sp. SPM9]MDG5491106.1 hypothetical protein [Psychroserpens sp. SPM9]